MKILIICNNGNSSSVLAQKMTKQAKIDNEDHQIDAIPPFDAKAKINEYDVVLIAPQIKHDLRVYSKLHNKVEVIPPMIFGMMDGKKALDLVKKIFES